MKLEILIPLGIFLVAFSIVLGAFAFVLRGVLGKAALAQKQVQKEFPWLFELGFRFQSSGGPFASIVAGRLSNGVDAKLHFRLPGRGYAGGVQYNGFQLHLLQLSHFKESQQAELSAIIESVPGDLNYQSDSKILWQPEAEASTKEVLQLQSLIQKLNAVA